MSTYRNILKHSGFYSIAAFAGKIAGFLLLPVYTHYLHPDDYGLIELLDVTTFLFATFVGVRLGDALLYYYAGSTTQDRKAAVTASAFVGSLLLCALTMGAGYFLAAPASLVLFHTAKYTDFFRLSFTALSFTFPVEVGLAYLRAVNNVRHYTFAALARLGLSISLTVTLLIGFHMKVAGVLWSGVMTASAMALYMTCLILFRFGVAFDKGLFWRQLRYAMPLTISGLGMLVIHYGDRYFLQRTVSLSDIGIYSLAYKMGMLVSLVQAPFNMYWNAQMFNIVREQDGDKVYVRIFTYLVTVLTVVAVLLSLFIHPVLKVMASPDFQRAAIFVPWIAAAYVLRGVGDQFRSVFNIHNRTGRHARVSFVGLVVCLALYAVLIPRFGVWGATFATVGGFLVMAAYGFREAQNVKPYRFEFRRLFQLFACSAVVILIHEWIHPEGFWPQVLVGIVASLAYGILLIATRFLHADEIDGIRSVLLRLPLFGKSTVGVR